MGTILLILRQQGLNATAMVPPPVNTSHQVPFFSKDPCPANYWCDHAGVLIFASALARVSKVSVSVQAILAQQWMAALWLGAQNIEQTKFLNWGLGADPGRGRAISHTAAPGTQIAG